MSHLRFDLKGTWDGAPLTAQEYATIESSVHPPARPAEQAGFLEIKVEAAYFGDPAPPTEPGPTPELWNFEVVELFLLGPGDHYLEVELGPHGHHLGLRLEGRRQIRQSAIPIEFHAERFATHWLGKARLSLDWLPDTVHAANAYAIHGVGSERRYLAAHPVPGPEPDFHRLEYFAPCSFD